jgi:hypothetical protein
MARVRVRLELPPDLDVSDAEVRGALADQVEAHLGNHLCKAQGAPRKLPHKHPQSIVDRATRAYQAQLDQMLDEIFDVLRE